MSYSEQIRDTVWHTPLKSPCCRRSFLSGILYARAEGGGDSDLLRLPWENNATLPLLLSLIRGCTGREPEVCRHRSCPRMLELSFSHRATAIAFHADEPPAASSDCPHCRDAFLGGLLVSVGRVSDPAREYRMEFACGSRAAQLLAFLQSAGYTPRATTRRRSTLLYMKKSEEIADYLARVGCTSASFELLNQLIGRQMRNDVNRIANSDTGNIGRAVEAAGTQTEWIVRLKGEGRLSELPPELLEIAELRLAYPDASLAQLALYHTPPLSRSGINHRLKRLCALAKSLLEE